MCVNKSYYVRVSQTVDNQQNITALFFKTKELAEVAYEICKGIQDMREQESQYLEPDPEYLSFTLSCIGCNFITDLSFILIKDPLWELVKWVSDTGDTDVEGASVYRVHLNRLISVHEMSIFHRAILNTKPNVYIQEEQYYE